MRAEQVKRTVNTKYCKEKATATIADQYGYLNYAMDNLLKRKEGMVSKQRSEKM